MVSTNSIAFSATGVLTIGDFVATKTPTAVVVSATSISSITATTAGSGYVMGDTITIATAGMPGRATAAKFTLVADDIAAATNVTSQMIVRKNVTAPIVGGIVTTVDALIASASTTPGEDLTEAIDVIIGRPVATGDITWGQGTSASAVAGTGIALKYTSSLTAITSITVTNPGSGYAVGNTLTVAASALGTRATAAVFTLVSDDIIATTPSFNFTRELDVKVPMYGYANVSTTTVLVDKKNITFEVCDGGVPLAGGLRGTATLNGTDMSIVKFQLTELQRVAAIRVSGTPGGDGIKASLDIAFGAFTDIASNPIELLSGFALLETPDVTPPTILSALLELGRGVLTLTMSETIDLAKISFANLTKFFLANRTGAHDAALAIQLQDAQPANFGTAVPVDSGDTPIINITLTEKQRVRAILLSGIAGGDGSALVLDMFGGAVRDVGQNAVIEQLGFPVTELPDLIPPTILSAEMNYSDGVLTVHLGEIIDATPALTKVNLTKISVSGRLTPGVLETKSFNLEGAVAIDNDEITLVIHLLESQRAAAVALSGVPGGDGPSWQTILLDCGDAVVLDIAQQPNVETRGVAVLEHNDEVLPGLVNVTMDYGTGELFFETTETMDVTPAVLMNLSQVFFVNNSLNSVYDYLPLDANGRVQGATAVGSVIPVTDATCSEPRCNPVLKLDIPEHKRVILQAMAGVVGGDGKGIRLDLQEGALRDLSGNIMPKYLDFKVFEKPDTRPPTIRQVSLNLSTGVLGITFSETILVTPYASGAAPASNVNMSSIVLSNTSRNASGFLAYPASPLTLRLNEQFDVVKINGPGGTQAVADPRHLPTVNIQLAEEQRARAVAMSGTKGGDGGGMFVDVFEGAVRDLISIRILDSFMHKVVEEPDVVRRRERERGRERGRERDRVDVAQCDRMSHT
jgi:hypothetical protein